MQKYIFIIVFILSSLVPFAQNEELRDFKKYFDEYGHTGSFVLYDMNNDTYYRYNPESCDKQFIPASTFKIFNSLAGLESGAVDSVNEIIQWDGVDRGWDEWNKDMDMAHAFRYSSVWFYQEIARRIGEKKMQNLINANSYGNKDISGGIDLFWLEGGFRVSPNEQVEFLKKLYNNELNFSERTMDLVKQIMISEQNDDYVLRTKTGWGIRFENQMGWFIGYLERDGNVYFFATNLESKNPEKGFVSRVTITKKILNELGLYPEINIDSK